MSHCSSAREQCGLSGCVFPLSHSQRVAVAYTSRRGKPFRCYVPSYAREQLVIQVQRNLVAQASQGSPKQAEEEAQPSTSGRFCLACGQELELISCYPEQIEKSRPPLLFLHGAMHGAWCFAENFLPFFANHGYCAHAMSLRGHGQSDFVAGRAGNFREHMDDIASVISSLRSPPILIAHSLGGVMAQRYLSDQAAGRNVPEIAGVAFLAAPALSATLRPSLRWFQQVQGFLHGLKIIWWMNAMPKNKKGLVKDLFFSADLPPEKFRRYHSEICKQRTILPINGRELTDFKGVLDRALGCMQRQAVPVLVMAAGADRMLMPCQIEALAQMFGCSVRYVPGVGHDLMLDTRWQSAAEELESWICSLPAARSL